MNRQRNPFPVRTAIRLAVLDIKNQWERSAIAILGIACGIAFFMSAQTSRILEGSHLVSDNTQTACHSERSEEPRKLGSTLDVKLPDGDIQTSHDLSAREAVKMKLSVKQHGTRNLWLAAISLLVATIGAGNAMFMSVTGRFREIGTMKCLGASDGFVRLVFLVESGLMGLLGGIMGGLFGTVFSLAVYCLENGHGAMPVFQSRFGALMLWMAISTGTAVLLSAGAAVYPAGYAAKMEPANALLNNV